MASLMKLFTFWVMIGASDVVVVFVLVPELPLSETVSFFLHPENDRAVKTMNATNLYVNCFMASYLKYKRN
jgi:hypothetical protein